MTTFTLAVHIADGVLSQPVMLATNALAALLVTIGLRKTDFARIPQVGVLAALFFVASLIHVRIGPSSAHLILNGFLGFFLGWSAFPAIAAALFLQAILFNFGGLTCLGCNIINTAVPALLVYFLFGRFCQQAKTARQTFFWGALAGGFAVVGTCVLLALTLHLSNAESYRSTIVAVTVAHLPIVLIEAMVTGAAAAFLYKMKPELLIPPVLQISEVPIR